MRSGGWTDPGSGIHRAVHRRLEFHGRVQGHRIGEREQLGRPHTGDLRPAVDPEVGVGQTRPAEAARGASGRGVEFVGHRDE